MKRNIFIGAAILIAACLPGLAAQSGLGDDTGGNKPEVVTFDAVNDGDGMIKILLYYDMEGVSGQNILTSIDFPRPEYFEARELLTADVNAVIEGLCAGGADSIFVVDAHGSFNPEPDILLDKMDGRARMIFRKIKFDPYAGLIDDNTYDAIVAVAMHSKTGGGGFAEHTVNVGTDWILNGTSVNESEILAFSWGRAGIPLIFVSGDDKLAEQLSWMDWLEYVTVKEARGIDDALLYPAEKVRKNLRDAARRGIENIDKAKVVRLKEPISARLRVIPPADLSILAGIPGIDYRDQSVSFQAADFQEAYDGMRGLMNAAQSGLYDIAAGILFNQGDESFMEFKNAVFEVWRKGMMPAGESKEPAEQTTADQEKLYFGSR